MNLSSKERPANNIDFCRTRTVLRAVLVSLWLSLCFGLFAARSLPEFWQLFTQASLFLLWSALLLVLVLCLLRRYMARYSNRGRLILELTLAAVIIIINSTIALYLMSAFFPTLQSPQWFVIRNLLLGLLLLPWLLRHPWLQGDGLVPSLDDAQLLTDKHAESPESDEDLLIKSHGNLLRINLGEVRYFYADNKYVTARGPEQEYIVDQSLKQLEERFGKHVFRVHRGYLVVTAFIRGLQNDALGRTEVIMQDLDERVPVSRRYAPAIRQFLKDLVKP